jgi:hypothetical protein
MKRIYRIQFTGFYSRKHADYNTDTYRQPNYRALQAHRLAM